MRLCYVRIQILTAKDDATQVFAMNGGIDHGYEIIN